MEGARPGTQKRHRTQAGVSVVAALLDLMCVVGSLTLPIGVGRAQDTVWTRRFDCNRPGWKERSAGGVVDQFGDPVHLGALYRADEPESTAAVVVKYNESGETLWTRVFESDANVTPCDAANDTGGNVAVTGYYEYPESTTCGALLAKYDRLGNLLWSRRYADAERTGFSGVAIDDSLNIFALGFSSSRPGGEVLLVKYNPGGVLAWTRTHALGEYVNVPCGLALDREGNLVGAGSIYDAGWTTWLGKFSSSGDTIWTRRLDLWVEGLGELTAVRTDEAGNIIVSGWGMPNSGEPMRALTAKFSPDGEMLWARTYGTSRHTFGFGVAVDSFAGILTVGSVENPPLGMTSSCLLLKYSPQGDTEWTRTYRLDSHNFRTSVGLCGSGSAYVFGVTEDTLSENSDMFVMKLRYEAGIEQPGGNRRGVVRRPGGRDAPAPGRAAAPGVRAGRKLPDCAL